MNLASLLQPWIQENIKDCEVHDLKNDSRLVHQGDLFIAYPGAVTDGRHFMEQAVAHGAAAILYEPAQWIVDDIVSNQVPCIPLPHLQEHLAQLAQRFYQNPSHALTVTGVTGTNGKTTIAYQLAQAHALLQQKAAYIGTIGQGDVNCLMPLDNTTPDVLCVQRLLHQYKEHQIRQVCMEVSSHALSQHRVDGIEFRQAIFTNLTLDHLDYHKTMDAYAMAKAQLFSYETLEWAIFNADDSYHEVMVRALKPGVKKITYGLHEHCDVCAVTWAIDLHGTALTVRSPWGTHQLTINAIGQFNIYNSLAVFSSLMAYGYDASDVIRVMAQLKAAPGRMELVAQEPFVLVDYAHTPDALDNALRTLKQLKKGALWVVFGCGGDRDTSKRSIMGQVASTHANKIVVTSDNPRSENPEQIIQEIVSGIINTRELVVLTSREDAILYALNHAAIEDVILIAGKGHEAYQQIGTKKYDFSDQNVVKAWIAQRDKP